MVCQQCGRENASGKFCRGCGTPLRALAPPPPAADPQPSAPFAAAVAPAAAPPGPEAQPTLPLAKPCPSCGMALVPAAAFCGHCGQSTAPAATPPTRSAGQCAACWANLNPGAEFCGSCGAPVADGPVAPAADQAGPYPAAALVLAPSSQPWPFQDRSTEIAAQAVSSLGRGGLSTQSGLGAMLARMIRAALFDKTIYVETAFDETLQSEVWLVAGLVIALSSFGYLLLSLLGAGLPNLTIILYTFAIQAAAWLARVWAVQLALSSWLKQPTDFRQLFRALSYAQSPAALRFIPGVGQVVELWALVANVAAIRDLSGRSTGQAAILGVIGFVAAALATNIASNLLAHMMY